jgi:hypothetical protein
MSDEAPTQRRSRFGRTLRFAVRLRTGQCSEVWSIASHKSSIYVASRAFGGTLKVSLHGDERDSTRSLICQVAHPTEYEGPLWHGSRTIHRWKRAPTPEGGVLHALSIQVPFAYVDGSQRDGTSKKPLLLIEADGTSDQMAEIGIFYSRKRNAEIVRLLARDGHPIGYFELPNGDTVSISMRTTRFQPARVPNGQSNREALEAVLAQAQRPRLGVVAVNRPKDGQPLYLVEVAAVRMLLDGPNPPPSIC